MSEYIPTCDIRIAMQSRIQNLQNKKKTVSDLMNNAVQEIYPGLISQTQLESINDGFNGALAFYDSEITHITKMMKFVQK
jgi:hypothetical protein